MEDSEIQVLVTRLARRQRDGSSVVERAAVLAEGADFTAVMEWIVARGGVPEVAAAPTAKGGLHAGRGESKTATLPLRFVLPDGALD